MQHGSSNPTPVSVVIVDDHRVVAEALSALLESTDDIVVLDIVSKIADLMESIKQHKPDVIICDLEMPLGDPFEALADALTVSPESRILILTAFATSANILRAQKLGVAGFMTKTEPSEAVVEGIRVVAAGRMIFSDEVRNSFEDNARGTAMEPRIITLSPRELHVTRMVAQGLTTQEIAKMVYRAPKTVEHQINSALAKTGSRNRVELTRWAIREGLVQP